MVARGCTCDKCIEACKRCPGWFAPGEAEKAAALLGLEFENFKARYLILEYWTGDKSTDYQDVYCLSPRMVGVDVGREVASYGSAFAGGRCVFLDANDRCQIHAAKPKECREAMCCEVNRRTDGRAKKCKSEIVQAWRSEPVNIEHGGGAVAEVDRGGAPGRNGGGDGWSITSPTT